MLSTTTTNLELVKPALTDAASIEVINANMDKIDAAYGSIANMLYPVGSIYMSVNSTSPATIFGGTWERLKDKFLIGAGDTYAAGATGGSATATLTTDNMPSHSHGLNSHVHSVGAHSHGLNSHTHSVGAHKHGLNSHTHSIGSHTHSTPAHSHDVSGGSFFICQSLTGSSSWSVFAQGGGGSGCSTTTSGSGTTGSGGSGNTGAASGNTANSSAFDTGVASGNTAESTAFDTGAASGNTESAGSGTAFSVMNPYLAVYMWKRTA